VRQSTRARRWHRMATKTRLRSVLALTPAGRHRPTAAQLVRDRAAVRRHVVEGGVEVRDLREKKRMHGQWRLSLILRCALACAHSGARTRANSGGARTCSA
jgi:hypothetical protein